MQKNGNNPYRVEIENLVKARKQTVNAIRTLEEELDGAKERAAVMLGQLTILEREAKRFEQAASVAKQTEEMDACLQRAAASTPKLVEKE